VSAALVTLAYWLAWAVLVVMDFTVIQQSAEWTVSLAVVALWATVFFVPPIARAPLWIRVVCRMCAALAFAWLLFVVYGMMIEAVDRWGPSLDKNRLVLVPFGWTLVAVSTALLLTGPALRALGRWAVPWLVVCAVCWLWLFYGDDLRNGERWQSRTFGNALMLYEVLALPAALVLVAVLWKRWVPREAVGKDGGGIAGGRAR
jgi:hypothetical protein